MLSPESMLSKARALDVTTKTMHSAREEDNFYRAAVSPTESGKRRLDKSRLNENFILHLFAEIIFFPFLQELLKNIFRGNISNTGNFP